MELAVYRTFGFGSQHHRAIRRPARWVAGVALIGTGLRVG
jgi:hypothetical protein